jgi:hypothetical protein
MNQKEILHLALENLQRQTTIKAIWKPLGPLHPDTPDGKLILMINDKEITYYVDIKKEWRNHQLPQIIHFNRKFQPFMVIAPQLFPKIREELRRTNVAYLEANGNVFLKADDILIWIDVNKPIQINKKTGNRAFTKTGLKVVFQFLTDEQWINKPYRQIAAQTNTGIGNITNIINGLKQEDFLLTIDRNTYRLNNKKRLLDQWTEAYELHLKPDLKVGTFRFQRENDFNQWEKLPLRKGKTYWGGEPGGDLLTHYLRPAELTLYTSEVKNDLIKNYRLVPDEKGRVRIYNKFWVNGDGNKQIAPPLLVYADLINTGDQRCVETAKKVYEQYLQHKF